MICSSSSRFILLQNGKALLWREDATERAGLPQAASVLVRAGEEVEDATYAFATSARCAQTFSKAFTYWSMSSGACP